MFAAGKENMAGFFKWYCFIITEIVKKQSNRQLAKAERMKPYLKLGLCVIAALVVGAMAALATRGEVATWYSTLRKPSFNPPDYLFGPAWTILYILMGISFFLVWQLPKTEQKQTAILLFVIQLILNFSWSFLFFKFHLLGIALIEILLLWVSVQAIIVAFRKVHTTAAWLQVPYLLWVSFASILNAGIWYLNR
jgi:tryptophan-rich sensory protein